MQNGPDHPAHDLSGSVPHCRTFALAVQKEHWPSVGHANGHRAFNAFSLPAHGAPLPLHPPPYLIVTQIGQHFQPCPNRSVPPRRGGSGRQQQGRGDHGQNDRKARLQANPFRAFPLPSAARPRKRSNTAAQNREQHHHELPRPRRGKPRQQDKAAEQSTHNGTECIPSIGPAHVEPELTRPRT